MPETCTFEPLAMPSRSANSVYSTTWREKASWRFPTRKIPRANNVKPAMMKIPTARYRLDTASLRNEFASDFVFALAYLVYRPEGDKISFVEHGDPVSYLAGPVHIMCHDDQGGSVFGFAPHE